MEESLNYITIEYKKFEDIDSFYNEITSYFLGSIIWDITNETRVGGT